MCRCHVNVHDPHEANHPFPPPPPHPPLSLRFMRLADHLTEGSFIARNVCLVSETPTRMEVEEDAAEVTFSEASTKASTNASTEAFWKLWKMLRNSLQRELPRKYFHGRFHGFESLHKITFTHI